MTRYRPPEILLGDDQYSPAVDIWSIGCIFAEIVNRSQPLFRGDSEISQLLKIFTVCGTINKENYPNCGQKLKFWQSQFPKWKEKPIADIAPDLDECGLDLMRRMLKLHPSQRITAKQALRHPYFSKIIDEQNTEIDAFPETQTFINKKKRNKKLSHSQSIDYNEFAGPIMAMV